MSRKTAVLMFSVGIIIIAYVIAIPNFVRDPWTSPENACINILRLMDAAKQKWAVETRQTNGPVSWNDILPYLTKEQKIQSMKVGIPHCPKGGTYTLGNIEELPKCSIEGHSLNPN